MNAIEKGFDFYIREILSRAAVIFTSPFSASIYETNLVVGQRYPGYRVQGFPIVSDCNPNLYKAARQLGLQTETGQIHKILDKGNHTQGLANINNNDPVIRVKYSRDLGEF